MNKEIGFYSLIQYCPDVTVGEVANIGVLLFVPESGFVDVHVTPTNHRVARIFGGGVSKYDTLQRYKEGLAGWIKEESRKFSTLEWAKKFLTVNTNSIVFTPIRGIVCTHGAENQLKTLFNDFFADELALPLEKPHKTPFAQRQVLTTLRKKYGREIGSRLALLPDLKVVGLERSIKPVFAFQNDHFNVVFSRDFSIGRAEEHIGAGLLIRSEMKQAQERYWKKSVPIIFGRIRQSEQDQDLISQIEETFKRYNIPFYSNAETLYGYISQAKPLPAFAVQFAADRIEPRLFPPT